MSPLERTLDAIEPGDFQTAMIRGMLAAYDARWRTEQLSIEVQHIESEWTADLVNLQSKRLSTSRTFDLGGKIDKVATINGQTVIVDHKTTSSDISDPGGSYWRQLSVEGQPSHYELLLHMNGVKVDDVIWDVVRKPLIKPKLVPKKDVAALASLGTYCGRKFDIKLRTIDTHGIEPYEGMKETPELFEARVAQLMTAEPDKYFARRSFKRTRAELVEYAGELWQIGQEIISARRHDRHYRNSGACILYGSPCQFLGICSGFDTPDSDKWRRKENVHEELDDVGGDGRDLLTNSRVRCFQTCRKKHYFQYEIGIKRVDEEEREPLRFGSAWHDAIDIYWNECKGLDDDNSNKTA